MGIKFRRAEVPREAKLLAEMNAMIFPPADAASEEWWRGIGGHLCYWLLVDDRRVGLVAMFRGVWFDFTERTWVEDHGVLYIAVTGVLPEFQGRGIGNALKVFEIEYARKHGFERIVTDVRASNLRIIRLNEKFGFRRVGTGPRFYQDPEEDALTLELILES